MSRARAGLVIRGQIVVTTHRGRVETAEALGIGDGRVVSVGADRDVGDAAAPGARVVDARDVAVVPGIHDAHIHLVALARARSGVQLDDAAAFGDVLSRVAAAARSMAPGSWLTGRGWHEDAIDHTALDRLESAVAGRPALLTSHDGHSAWASAEALRAANIDADSSDPAGGRIERGASGEPSGVLREAAMDGVAAVAGRLTGDGLAEALDATLRELASLGITGATEAGDYTVDGGMGPYAALGDSFSSLVQQRRTLDDRLRLNIGLPADGLHAAAEMGLRTGLALPQARTLRIGWAKAYSDGALGSRTAALFEPYSCDEGRETGILRLGPDALDQLYEAGHAGGIGVAVHAIGDRAVASVIDAAQRAGRPRGRIADRMEHVQLIRPVDVERLAAAGLVASMQPVHAAADRDLVDRCWAGREANAYPMRSVAKVGARLAFGSDAPIETHNPWHGIFAAVHRRFPGDGRDDWRAGEGIDVATALDAYTRGPAVAMGADDEGRLAVGARADLAVLDIDLATLLAGDERLASVRSRMTLVDGTDVVRS